MTQTEQVLEYMEKYGSIDPYRAFSCLRILRLGARIWDLKKAGFHIETEIKTKNTDGTTKRWAEYRLEKPLPVNQTEERQEVEAGRFASKDNTSF